MSLPTPAQLAQLAKLKAEFRMKAEMEKRKAQAIANAEKQAGKGVGLETDKKAKGGLEKFLKDSKIKHRVYHGTTSNVHQFDLGQASKQTGNPNAQLGHFFSASPEEASRYATDFGNKQGANVMPVYLNIKNPKRLTYKEMDDLAMAMFDKNAPVDDWKNPGFQERKAKRYKYAQELSRQKRQELIDAGYDGAVVRIGGHDEYIAFHPTQVKSAIGNRGTYDPNDPDITKAKGGSIPSHDVMRLAIGGESKADHSNPFDYENPEHVHAVAGHLLKHKEFNIHPESHRHLSEMLGTGHWKYIEDPRFQSAIRKAGHDSYYVKEKEGKKSHLIHKAVGGAVQPTIPQMKMQLLRSNPAGIQSLGANEAPDMSPKTYVPPDKQTGKFIPPGGAKLPAGGIDMNPQQPGQQLMPQQPMQQPTNQQPQAPQGMQPQDQQDQGGNILQMTPQGQTMAALGGGQQPQQPQQPQGLAEGGQPEDEYRGSHTSPGPHFGAPMHDVTRDMYPKDFYGPNGFRYYADFGEHYDREAYDKVRRIKGKPDEMVSIHRAIPTRVYKEALKKDAPLKHMIRKGDWVAIAKEYAKQHGESVLNGDYKIASMRVPARHVWTNGDSIHEWGYHPDEKKAKGGSIPSQDAMRCELTMKKGK